MNGTLTQKPTLVASSAQPGTAPRKASTGLIVDVALLMALLLVLAVQAFFLINDPPQINQNPPRYFYLFIPLVWVLLTAGALAPELRRRPKGSKILPPSTGLWLATWLLMGMGWSLIVFNRNSDALWGFWHYDRLDLDERIAFLTLIPLVLAPGWPRLARWMRLSFKRRFGTCKQPDRHNIFIKHIFPVAALALIAWLLCDLFITSDGWGLIGNAETQTPIDPYMYREYGCLLLYRYGFRLIQGLGLYAADFIHIINFLATLGSLALIGWLMRLWPLTRRQRHLGWWLTLSTLGLTQMLLGHVEVYPLVQLGLIASLVTGVAALRGRCHLGWCAVAYGLLLAFHLSGAFIFPAMVLVTLFWARPLGQAAKTRHLKAAAWMLGIGLLIHGPLWSGAMLQLDNPTPAGLIQAHLSSLNTGAEKKTFIGTGTGTDSGATEQNPLAAILAPANLFKVFQILFYIACAPLLMTLLISLCRPLGWNSGTSATPNKLRKREGLVLMAAWVGYATYALTWHNDFSWVEDWDLFSGLASLSLLGALFLLMPASGLYRLPWRLARTVCLFSLAIGFSQHYFYHSRGAYLNFRGKIVFVRSSGALVQRFQFDHGWDYGVTYKIKDGKVLPTRKGKVLPATALNKHR